MDCGYFFMETEHLLRQQLIEGLTAEPPENVVSAAIGLWEQLSGQIVAIVGQGGFDSLYARSLFLSQSTFPWLGASAVSAQTGRGFAELKTSLEGQTPAQAAAANSLLLVTFTDILAALIGEQLTTRILRSAWSNNAQDTASRELQND